MKLAIRMALMTLAATSAGAFAQDGTPQCASLFDGSRNMFTSKFAPEGAINQQCFLTVLPKDGPSSDPKFPQLAQYPAPQLREGTYEILLSGGGGGGGGGDLFASGGGGAGAVPVKTTQYLTPGVYKLTIGTGGNGGSPGITGRLGQDGNPTSMTEAYSNELVAGFAGADVWAGRRSRNYMVASAKGISSDSDAESADSSGGHNPGGRGDGGAGGRLTEDGKLANPSADGAPMTVAGIPTGRPGQGGENAGGGGGGAGYGDGADALPGGQEAQPGGKGGYGFVMLRPIELAQATPPAPAAASAESAPKAYVAPTRARKRDRN